MWVTDILGDFVSHISTISLTMANKLTAQVQMPLKWIGACVSQFSS